MCWSCLEGNWLPGLYLEKNEKGLDDKEKVIDSMVDRLQNFCHIVVKQNENNMKVVQSAVRFSLFQAASSNENN